MKRPAHAAGKSAKPLKPPRKKTALQAAEDAEEEGARAAEAAGQTDARAAEDAEETRVARGARSAARSAAFSATLTRPPDALTQGTGLLPRRPREKNCTAFRKNRQEKIRPRVENPRTKGPTP